MLRLVLPGALLAGVALGLSSVGRAGEPTPVSPDAGINALPQPSQTEVAGLKREAVAVGTQLIQAYPEDALAYALLGSAFYNTGRSIEGSKYLQKCLELNPDQADAYEILARIAYEKGNLEESASLCHRALKHGPANAEVLNQLGRALLDLARTDEAIQVFQQAVGLARPSSQSFYLLGQANLQSGNYVQAKENFLRAVALLPDHTQAYFALYRACLALGQTDEAQRYREQFVKLEEIDRRSLTDRSAQEDTLTGLPLVRKTVARTLFGAGQIYRVHQEPIKAAELFRKAASLDADNMGYRAALETSYLQRKEPAEGVQVFEQLAREQPDNALNYLFLGRLRARLEQSDGAESAFQKVQELAPQWAEGYRALAELYLRANHKLAQAEVLARRAVALEPSAAHYFLLAVASVKINNRPAGLEAIKHAIELAPREKRYLELLQQLTSPP